MLKIISITSRKKSSHINIRRHSEKHKEHHAAMVKAVEAATNAEDLTTMRAAFKNVSAELIKAVENQGYGEKLFVRFCPMEKEGYWLSKEENVKNPFFEVAMPTCEV